MSQLSLRNIKDMGGLAGKMPTTSTSSIIAALSLSGTPPFACFISEVLIFMGAFQTIQAGASFFIVPTALMLVSTVLSLAYSLRFISTVFFGPTKPGMDLKRIRLPKFMQAGMVILAVLVVVIGIYPTFFIHLIETVPFWLLSLV